MSAHWTQSQSAGTGVIFFNSTKILNVGLNLDFFNLNVFLLLLLLWMKELAFS